MRYLLRSSIHKAMTLAECLIVVAVIGLVAGITIPTLKVAIPDKNENLHKKGDYFLEHVVSDVVNNEDYYPVKKEFETAENGEITVTKTYGLKNTDEVIEHGNSYSGATKFCELVASKFTLYPDSTVDCSEDADYSFTSSDGIKWKFPVSDFSTKQSIVFRTMDRREGTDCFYNKDTCRNPNLFLYEITPEGRLFKKFATHDKLKPQIYQENENEDGDEE